MFKNKILLVTGGTGSFGKAIISRFINTDNIRLQFVGKKLLNKKLS